MPSDHPLCAGLVERIGVAGSDIQNHEQALQQVLNSLSTLGFINSPDEIDVVGHRVVHGGESFLGPTIITDEVKAQIKALFSLAPLHNQVSYTCIEVAEKTFPTAKQIAVFDTAYHQTLPDYAYRYAIPKKYYTGERIRKYGFHGTSHKYVGEQAAKYLGKTESKIITIHLGNGCSMAALLNSKSIETSMGFGPLSGLMMGTRSGDIDPSVIFHLLDHKGYTPADVNQLLNKASGLQGMAGSNDMRDVHRFAAEGDAEASLALAIYAYRIKLTIGAYAAVLNGLDAIVFTAGVGENDQLLRAAVCRDLSYLGIELDGVKNGQYNKEILEINRPEGKVKIMIIPTNEEVEIANQCYEMLHDK